MKRDATLRGNALAALFFLGMGWVMTADAQLKEFSLRNPATYFSGKQSIALLEAAMSGNLAKAKHLVAAGADPNDEGPVQPNVNRLRLLHYAIASGNKEAVKVLYAVGADPELNAKHNGPAFLFAVTLNNIEMLALLLDLRPIKGPNAVLSGT